MLKNFIKKLIINLPALLLFIITTKTKASDDTEIFISPSCTINVLDPQYVYADSKGEIGYYEVMAGNKPFHIIMSKICSDGVFFSVIYTVCVLVFI